MRKRIAIIGIFTMLILQGCYPNNRPVTDIESSITSTAIYTPTQSPSTSRTQTFTLSKTPSKYYTALPSIDISNIPSRIYEGAEAYNIFTTNEIAYLVNILKKSAKDRDPYPLLDFIVFPMHELNRCPGDVINTPSEFVTRFPEFMTDTTRNNILNLNWDDVWPNDEGLGIAVNSPFDVWFITYCDNNNCAGGRHIVLNGYFGYGTYWEYVEGYPTPKPTYDYSLVNYGEYKTTKSYYNLISHGELTRLDETLSDWKKFYLLFNKTSIKMGPYIITDENNVYLQESFITCDYNGIEVCPPPEYNKWLWAGEYNLGELLFICNNSFTERIIILNNNRLGVPMSEGYLILELISFY
jgi:hypothetical protein